MKRLLQLGFALGLAGTLASAWFVPWFEYPRYRSGTSVVANGGRLERFVVHLPADRIESRADSLVVAQLTGASSSVEHFKLRDSEDNVIGIVARHEQIGVDTIETAWLLTVPSRGSVALVASSPVDNGIQSELSARGIGPGQDLAQALSIDSAAPARSVTATGEFEDIEFELTETWLITGVSNDGRIRGSLHLSTVGRRSS